jgi:hypothetical protein
MKYTKTPGQICFVQFAKNDPQYPIVFGWEGFDSTAKQIALVGSVVNPTANMLTWMGQVATALNALAPGSVSPALPSSFASIINGSTIASSK